MKRPNEDIREAARKANVYLWQIAKGLGIADTTLSRWLREELPAEIKEKIYTNIKLAKEAS